MLFLDRTVSQIQSIFNQDNDQTTPSAKTKKDQSGGKILHPANNNVLFAAYVLIMLIMIFLPKGQVHAEGRTVRVGVYQNKPKIFLNEKGQADGFFIDLLEEIARLEDWNLTYKQCEWQVCLAALETGQIDLMPDMAYSSGRDEKFDFHHIPAAESWSRVYSNTQVNIERIDQLDGKILAVLNGSIQQSQLESVMQDYGIEFSIIVAQSWDEVFQLVADDFADAALTNYFFGDNYYQDYGLVRTPVVVNITTLYYTTAEGKNQDLLNAIDSHLGIWRDDPNSVYSSLMNHWLDQSAARKLLKNLKWVIGGIAALLCFSVGWVLLLHKQVKNRTRHLEIANQKLSQNEELYKSISALTSDYMFSSNVNENGLLSFNWVAGAFEAITGYTLEEYESHGGWRAILHPDDLAVDDQDMDRLYKNQPVKTEIRTIAKNGKTKWLQVYAHPVWDMEQNKLTGIYGAVQEITQRKMAENKLREANSLLTITGTVARVGGWEYDLQTGELNGTEEMFRIYEIDPSTPLSLSEVLNYFAPESRPTISEAIQNCIDHGDPWYLELPLITGKGHLHWVSVQGTAERENGKIIRLFGAFQDITKYKLSEEKIRQQTSRAEALVHTASNINSKLDLNAVLSAVCEETAKAMMVPAVALHLFDELTQTLSIVADYGLPVIFREKNVPMPISSFPPDMSPALDVPIILDDVQAISDIPNADLIQLFDFRTIVFIKIKSKETYIGSLSLFSIGNIRQFSADELALLEGLSNQAAQAISNAHLYENTERQLRNIEALHTIDTAIANSMDIRLTLKVVAEETIRQMGVDAINFLLYKPASNRLESSINQGFRTTAMKNVTLRIGEGLAGQVASDWQRIFIPDISAYHNDFPSMPVFKGEDFVSYCGLPLRAKGQFIGVMEIFNRTRLNPDQEWFNFLETLAGQAAIAIDGIKAFEEIQISNTKLILAYDATIEGWSRAMDMRDKETEGHTQRVAQLTIQLARKMGITEDQIVHIKRGALLHDIGKLGIPDQILLKTDNLTEKQWVIMRKHPQYAFDMLSSIDYLRPALDIPYCHHEKWDGTGYPRGLKGLQIPLAARIFSIIDVWDALTSNRPYRPAWEQSRALEYIEQQSGSHFDPQVVSAFLSVMSEMNNSHTDE
ncbi:MAG: transporter substrate-binding domain-containing protein [Chloroflexi bacterium]|nr:transporter substrate-binding domain-containing protein [Chloroflexota bacterium]